MAKSRKGVVKNPGISWAEGERLKKENQQLRFVLRQHAYNIVFIRDALEESGNRLFKENRLQPNLASSLKLQILTLENVLANVYGIPLSVIEEFRKFRKATAKEFEQFDKTVEATMQDIAPRVTLTTPDQMRGAKFNFPGMKVPGGKLIVN